MSITPGVVVCARTADRAGTGGGAGREVGCCGAGCSCCCCCCCSCCCCLCWCWLAVVLACAAVGGFGAGGVVAICSRTRRAYSVDKKGTRSKTRVTTKAPQPCARGVRIRTLGLLHELLAFCTLVNKLEDSVLHRRVHLLDAQLRGLGATHVAQDVVWRRKHAVALSLYIERAPRGKTCHNDACTSTAHTHSDTRHRHNGGQQMWSCHHRHTTANKRTTPPRTSSFGDSAYTDKSCLSPFHSGRRRRRR